MKNTAFLLVFSLICAFCAAAGPNGAAKSPAPHYENADAAGVLGDYDNDRTVTSDDAVYLLRHTLFPQSYALAGFADLDRDGEVTSDDAVYLLRHTLFSQSYPLAGPEDTVSDDPGKEESGADGAPVITLAPFTEVITINKGASWNALESVSAYDTEDGDLTGVISVTYNGFDPNTPGEYTIAYKVSDNDGNEAKEVERTVTVKDSAVFAEPPVWQGAVQGEKAKPASPAVFGGAWYRKVVSSKDSWVGIEATVTLPEVVIRRYDGEYNDTLPYDPESKNLDNPSVYLGGSAGSESDVGLSFSRTLYRAGSTNLTKSSFAFRPFWRYITSTDKDAGGYDVHGGEYAVTANGSNCYANYHWKYTEYYYLPGDTLRMVVFSPAPGKLQLQIEVIAKSTLPSSVAVRQKYGWKDPADFISPVFASPGHGTEGVLAEFKRVNAIDQTGNEGKTAIETQTAITGAVWHSAYLYRYIDGVLYRVPMTEDRRGEVNAPQSYAFTVTAAEEERALGGERVDIAPGK